MAEHYRGDGMYGQGYYCSRCGGQGLSMYGGGRHGVDLCRSDPILVSRLNELNTYEAEQKRKFLYSLKHGK